MNLLQPAAFSQDPNFLKRCAIAGMTSALAVSSEVANEAQTLSLTGGSSGTFTLAFAGQTTAAISATGAASGVQTALQALSSIGNGNVVCTGGPLPGTAVTITFTGTLGAMPQNLITIGSQPTGGTATVTRSTAGLSVVNHSARQLLASKVVSNPTGYGIWFAVAIATNPTVQADFDPNTLTPRGGSITNATAGNPCVITSSGSNVPSNSKVLISGAAGNINGLWTATNIDANTFSVPIAGPGAGGGAWAVDESQILSDVQFQMNSIFNAFT